MRLLIATPVDGNARTGSVCAAYHRAVLALQRMGDTAPLSLIFNDDIVRARSQAVHFALKREDWDYVLWIDSDTVFDPEIVPRMLATGHPVVGAPYPRKRIPARFPYKPLDESLQSGGFNIVRDCIEVDYLGFGFMLTSRKALQSMVDWYREEDWYTLQHPDGDLEDVVGLFKQIVVPRTSPSGRKARDLLSEDYSFCHRWRAIGGKVQMYVGEGAPLGHVGLHEYTAELADLARLT